MRFPAASACLVALVCLAGGADAQPPGSQPDRETRIIAGESCPAGTTEIRPRICRAPESPPPSILDYRPRSTLVTPAHPIRAAKYPAIDFHGHPRDMITSREGLAQLAAALDSLNVRGMVAADNLSGERLGTAVAAIRSSPTMKDRVRVFAGIDFRNVGPGWAEKAVKQLEADVAAGAVGIGEISKSLGLTITKSDGSRLRIDAPELDPIWEAAARLKIPVFIHTADPQEFFRPVVDLTNERWLELSLFPGRRYPQDKFPSFNQLMTERDNLFRKHPKTTFVAAHMGWHANDLGRLGKLLDDFPNVFTEVGAVLYDIGRQPHGAHDFFVKYQDRIMFGKDSFQPGEYPYYWRVFETRDEYFDYYRDYHASWKLYAIDLPDSVLKKVYYQNALRITRGFPQVGGPLRTPIAVTSADSIMLERTTCFGACPAYRLSVTAAGRVSFLSLNPGDSGRAASDSISREKFESLVSEAESLGFFTLPDTIANDRALCPMRATDHPSAVLTVYRRAGNKQVVDYHGCVARSDRSTTAIITALRSLEARVDSIAGSDRWVKPASRAP